MIRPLVAGVAVAGLGVGTAVSLYFALPGGDEEAVSQPPQETAPAETPGLPTLAPTPIPGIPDEVPAATTPPPGVTCPAGWLFFDNPVDHYSICYPPGWGFSNFDTTGPLLTLQARAVSNLHLLSPDSFPMPAGTPYVELAQDVKARLDNSISFEIGGAPPGVVFKADGCQPDTPIDILGVQGLTCLDVYDVLPGPVQQFRPDGSRHTLTLLLPLAQKPVSVWGDDTTGFKFLLFATTSSERYAAAKA